MSVGKPLKDKPGNAFEDEVREQHPSYGLVQFNRQDHGGARRLFGSALPGHGRTVGLKIYTDVQRISHKGTERYYPAKGLPAIEVELSAAQFAELITTMNVGFGVPCTVRHVNGKQPADPPEVKHQTEHIRDDFEAVFTEAVARLKTERDDLLAAVDGRVTKKVVEAIKHSFYMAIMAVERNAPFYMEQFEEATEKITDGAKAEVDAFMTSAIQKAGMRALRMDNGGPVQPRPGLPRPAGYDPDDQHGTSFDKPEPEKDK